jgi:hypothetical protein
LSKDSDLEERTVFADDVEGRTIAVDADSTQSVRAERKTLTDATREELTHDTVDQVNHTAREVDDLVSRTGYAAEGVRLALLFAHQFGRRPLGRHAHLMLRLNEPGLTTEGGTKARQSLVLVPKDERRGTTTIGWLDSSRLLAELKSYALIAEQHRARRHEELDIARDEYERLGDDLSTFLRNNGLTLSIADVPSGAAGAAARALPERPVRELAVTPRSIGTMIALILALGMMIGAVVARGCDDGNVHEIRLDDDESIAPKDLRPERRLSPNRTR